MTRIAFVEDDAETRDRVTVALRGRGFEVQCFLGLTDAAAHLEEYPDLLITEASLRDGSGLDLIARLRDATPHVFPVIVVSGRVTEQDILRGYAAGASDYVIKPYQPDELLAKSVVQLARCEREHTTLGPLELPTTATLAFGRYRVSQALGKGSGGVVYAAVDRDTGRAVALKVLTLLEDLAEARLRFLREVYALSSVRDAHVAEAIDFGSAEGRLYYAMERIDGSTVHRKVAADGPATELQTLALLDGLTRALVALRRADLVHRDVKPGNVVLRGGRWEQPVLVDFGLAKRPFDRGLTAPDVWTGTPGYIPPEVVLGASHDVRGDLFSLGLVARYALTGEEPFPEMRGLSLLYHMTREQFPVPTTVSTGLQALLGDLTRLDPAARPGSADDVLRRLDGLRRRRAPRAA